MEKSISLKETQNVLINLEKATDRLEASTKVLGDLDIPFDRFEAVEHSLGIVGCGLSHLCLMKSLKPGTVIFEDDIGSTKDANTFLTFPEDTDAVYLGVSNHGYIRKQPWGFAGVVLASQQTPTMKRVLNMCSTHAILYLSERYIKAVEEKIEECLKDGTPFDLGIASLHKDFNVLTPNDPWFYQTEQPELTNFSLEV